MSSNKNLTDLRDDINNVDSKILNLLSERRKLSEEIINTKIESDQPIRDTQRETELLSRIITEGKELELRIDSLGIGIELISLNLANKIK